MSPGVTGLVLLWALLPWPQPDAPAACAPEARAVLDAAAAAAFDGEFAAAEAQLRGGYDAHGQCRELGVAAWAWGGWQAAVAAAEQGGTEQSLTRIYDATTALGPPSGVASVSSYAASVLRAAAAAAQDEREEMQVWLEHARALASTLSLAGEHGRWPLPIDLVDGELWSSVDDYELAEVSYTRALAERDSAIAWRGLGRARDRRGNREGACAAYRRARDLASPQHPKGVVATEARGYLLICEP